MNTPPVLKADAESLVAAYLTESNQLSVESLERAKRGMLDTGDCLGDVICRLGLLSETKLVGAFKEVLGFRIIDKLDFGNHRLSIDGVSDLFLASNRAIPVSTSDSTIELAVANPLDDFVKRAVEYVSGKTVEYRLAPSSEIDIYLDDQKDATAITNTGILHSVDCEDMVKLRDMASDAPVIRYVNRLFHLAVAREASDIHIEPMEHKLHVRFRINGLLEDIEAPPAHLKSAITSRIKIVSGLDIAERRVPQDGRIRMPVQGRDVDFRVSTTPTAFGESVVLRILNQTTLNLELDSLGFSPSEQDLFRSILDRPHGIILVTGPTGSGKTTTLYTALNILNQPMSKILTIEDPIEYMLEGINQVQVNNQIGLGFASALRTFLRQDPDIMMVGEIRDYETAQIAVQASLTGHLILSTLHTNTAAGAIARLLDMGVEDFLLASTVNVVLGQRLVRKLCRHCKTINEHNSYEPHGCSHCQDSGYTGRTMVVEILQMSDAIRALIRSKASAQQIERQAIEEGMQTIKQRSLALVSQGITSQEEVFRVLGNDNL